MTADSTNYLHWSAHDEIRRDAGLDGRDARATTFYCSAHLTPPSRWA